MSPETRSAHLAVTVVVAAPQDEVWAALSDWERQSEWIPATRVRTTEADGRGVGGGIEAWTGIGRLGFLDTMVVTEWDPPQRCFVRHTGRFVRGTGGFEVTALDAGLSRVLWREDLHVPWGVVGRAGWPLLRPAVRVGISWALRRFKREVERRGR